jgi:hypothetical protein
MRFMVMVKATDQSEAGEMPGQEMLEQMQKYNEELVKAGVMLAGEGLHPETKELVAGFWLWDVKSKEEAIEWVKRCPNPMDEESEIEIRQVFEEDDFGELTPEMRETNERLRQQVAENQ